VPSATCRLFCTAILERKQIVCEYDGCHRELCPHVLYARLREGLWRTGKQHGQPQACVDIVDLDVNR
jgi:hypothetical protein